MSETDLRVLKNIISDRKVALDFVNANDVRIFSSDYWHFANLTMSYIKKYQDVPTLRSLQELSSKVGNPILPEKIENIWEDIDTIKCSKSELQFDVDKLKARSAEAELFKIKNELSSIKPGSVDVQAILNRFNSATQSIQELYNDNLYESKNVKEYLSVFVDKYNFRKNNPDEASGLLTHYSFLDYATNGLRPADMVLIAGESGFGKSLFLQNIAVQVWQQKNNIASTEFTPGKNIIYFSLEMPYDDCFNRFLSKMSGVPSRRIEKAQLTRDEFARVKDVLQFIHNYPDSFRIVDITDVNSNDLESAMIKTGDTYDAAFVDYLGIMNVNDKSDEADWMKQSQISYELRNIARKYKIPLFSAVQLNRKSQKEGSDNIGLSRLARSSGIATHATHVIQIESRQNETQYPDFLYHIIKNRKGPKGKGVLNKNLSCATLTDKPMPQEEDNSGFTDLADDISFDLNNTEDLALDFI